MGEDGFDKDGIHKSTGTEYGPDGYDRIGYNKYGFHKNGIHRITKTKYDQEGYDVNGFGRAGYDRDGYTRYGFSVRGIHKSTGTEYDPDGYNIGGYNKDGYHRSGYNQDGYNKDGYNKDGYNKDGYNKDGIFQSTGTKYGPDGYDKNGYNIGGYNKNGYNKDGYDMEGYHVTGFHPDTGLNRRGFNIHGIHKSTGTEYDPDGYNKDGYNKDGYNKDGYNKDGIFQSTGTKYGPDGYNIGGYNKDGYNKDGIFESTRTKYDPDGYNKDGFDREGYDKNGWNPSLRDLPLHELVSFKRSSNFYDLRQRKKETSFNFMNKPKHWTGIYYSKNHYPDQYTSDELTQTIIRNKHETNGNTPAQYISKLMHEYLTEKNLGPFDCIIPVANHKQNFEQISGAVSIGQELGKLLKVECLSNALEKTLNIKARTIFESQKREFWNNNDLYVFSGIHNVQDKKILIVDDVITHDYTISQCIYQLGNEGPKDITVLCAGRTKK